MAKVKLSECLYTIPATREGRNMCRVLIAIPAVFLFAYLWKSRRS